MISLIYLYFFLVIPANINDPTGNGGNNGTATTQNPSDTPPANPRKSRSPEKTPPKKRSRRESESSRRSHKSNASKKPKANGEKPSAASAPDEDKIQMLQAQMDSIQELIQKMAASNDPSTSKRKAEEQAYVPNKKRRQEFIPPESEDDSEKDVESSDETIDWGGAAQPTSLRKETAAPASKMATKPWLRDASDSEEDSQDYFNRRPQFEPGTKARSNQIHPQYNARYDPAYVMMGCPRMRNIQGSLVKYRAPDFCTISYQGKYVCIKYFSSDFYFLSYFYTNFYKYNTIGQPLSFVVGPFAPYKSYLKQRLLHRYDFK